jgi:hypothetical protein
LADSSNLFSIFTPKNEVLQKEEEEFIVNKVTG